MNIMTKQGRLDNIVTYQHICDTSADIANIPSDQITLGSTCIVLVGETGGLEVFMADSQKEWQPITILSGESGSSNIFNITNPQDGDALIYDGNTEKWVNMVSEISAADSASAAADSAAAAAASASAAMSTTPTGYNSILNSIVPEYDSDNGIYAIGDYCRYNAEIYRCITAIKTAEAFTSAKWKKITVGRELTQIFQELEIAEHLYFKTAEANVRWPRITLPVINEASYILYIVDVIAEGTYDKVYAVQGSTDMTGNIPIGASASFTVNGNDPVYLTIRFNTTPSVLPKVVYYLYPTNTGFRDITASGVAITVNNKTKICNGDCNNIPTNTIFGVNSDTALNHGPGFNNFYNIITSGKASIRTAGDTQIAFNTVNNEICYRNYSSSTAGWTIWRNISNGDSAEIKCGLSYISSSNTTSGKAMNKNGNETQGITYMYTTFPVTEKEIIYVTGYHFANSYPLYIFYNSNDEYISSATLGDNGHVEYQYKVIVPLNATKVIVNGQRSDTYGWGIPAVQQYNNNLSLNDFYNSGKKRRYLFIGDSYCEGYTHDENNSGWAIYCASYLQLESADYVRIYQGGARFSSNNSNNTFEALLRSSQYPFNYFTDIVVCGGYNDHSYTQQNVLDGISSFVSLAKLMYPNARIHIGFIGWNKAGNGTGAEQDWQTYHQQMIGTILPAYQKCIEYGARYLNNVEYWLGDNGLSSSDGYHPNESGNKSIARAIANALSTGSAPIPYNNNLRLS